MVPNGHNGAKRQKTFSLHGVTEEPDRKKWMFPRAVLYNPMIEGPRDVTRVLETDVINGDCLPACLAAVLEAMHFGKILSFDFEPAAAKMRSDITNWIKTNWTKPCLFNMSMCYHELIALSHDSGISSAERSRLGQWPDDPEGRLARYTSQENDLYFCDAEMMAFAEMMHDEGMDMVFRVWRNFTPASRHKSTLISITPDPDMLALVDIHKAVVVDLAHVGERDGKNAHYKLCNSGSLYGLIMVVQSTNDLTIRAF